MKSKIKQEKAITLIALVVTIIVLLILAGISISMLTGENGILNRASEAKEKTGVAQEEETQKLQGYEDTINQYAPGSNGGNSGGGSSGDTGNLPETATGQTAGTAIKNPTSYGTNPNAQATADGDGKYFAKPEGATYVTGTVDTGVVVEIKGSEFVWVPVDDVVLDTSKTADLPTSSSSGISNGKTYTPMAVNVDGNYKGILYNFSGSNSYLMYPSDANYQGSSSQYREPDVVSSYDGGSYDTVDGKITTERLTSEYNAMIASVLKYKGFYVARYEAGLDADKNIVFKNASTNAGITTTDSTNSETKTWYGLYKKIKTFTTENDKVVSNMIWGSQYDAMMNWMEKNGKNVGSSNSSIYNNTTTTGSKDTDIVNNVYDLYGCHYEWTLEASISLYRAYRGGDSYNYVSPASRNDYGPTGTHSSNSSRATLYIK